MLTRARHRFVPICLILVLLYIYQTLAYAEILISKPETPDRDIAFAYKDASGDPYLILLACEADAEPPEVLDQSVNTFEFSADVSEPRAAVAMDAYTNCSPIPAFGKTYYHLPSLILGVRQLKGSWAAAILIEWSLIGMLSGIGGGAGAKLVANATHWAALLGVPLGSGVGFGIAGGAGWQAVEEAFDWLDPETYGQILQFWNEETLGGARVAVKNIQLSFDETVTIIRNTIARLSWQPLSQDLPDYLISKEYLKRRETPFKPGALSAW